MQSSEFNIKRLTKCKIKVLKYFQVYWHVKNDSTSTHHKSLYILKIFLLCNPAQKTLQSPLKIHTCSVKHGTWRHQSVKKSETSLIRTLHTRFKDRWHLAFVGITGVNSNNWAWCLLSFETNISKILEDTSNCTCKKISLAYGKRNYLLTKLMDKISF